MKTKRKKLITVMIGIILLVSQQIIAGTNYVKTVNSTGGTVNASEFVSTYAGATIVKVTEKHRQKNRKILTIIQCFTTSFPEN